MRKKERRNKPKEKKKEEKNAMTGNEREQREKHRQESVEQQNRELCIARQNGAFEGGGEKGEGHMRGRGDTRQTEI